MGILVRPYCLVSLTEERHWHVDIRHYEGLKDEVEAGVEAWRELDLFEHASGRCLVWVPDITDLGCFTQAWCDAREEQERERKAQARIDGEDV
jgi:hypothetical protein